MPVSAHILERRPARSGRGLLVVLILVELFARHLLLGHVGELQEEIDYLVLVDRRAQLGKRIGVFLIVLPDFLFAAGHGARAFDCGAADFVLGDRDLVLFADLGQHKAEPHAAVGDLAVLFLRGLFRGVLVGKALAAGFHLGTNR